MVEPQIVVLVVAGSSPVDHPAFSEVISEKWFVSELITGHYFTSHFRNVSVAQLDRAADFGSAGWGFESLQARASLESMQLGRCG